MTSHDLDRMNGNALSLTLKPGMYWALYLDDGPGGPCGQSMRTTCPHTVLHVWPDEAAMRAGGGFAKFGRNKNGRWMYGVVDEYTSRGVFRIEIHGETE